MNFAQKIIILLLLIAFLVMYNIYERHLKNYNNIEKEIERFRAVNLQIIDKLEIKDKEIQNAHYEINRYKLNLKALTGTDCIRCHLEQPLLFPINNNLITYDKYKEVVRKGLNNYMPKYNDDPSRSIKSITNHELRRQYEILKPLFENGSP